jgi:hypothetical protein
MCARLVSVNVAQAKPLLASGRKVLSAIGKHSVQGGVRLSGGALCVLAGGSAGGGRELV